MSWRHSLEILKCSSVWSVCKSLLFQCVWYSSAKLNICVLRWPCKGNGKIEFSFPVLGFFCFPENIPKLLFSSALLGICCLLVFQFGRSLVDVAAKKPWHRQFCKLLTWESFQDFHLMTLHYTHKALRTHFPWHLFWAVVVIWLTHRNSIRSVNVYTGY